MSGFVDLFVEPILWFIVSGIILVLGIWFSVKVKQAEPEARPVLSGIMVFLLGWGIVRFIETIRRYYVVDAVSGEVSRHSASMQAYTDQEFRAILEACGFENVRFFSGLTGGPPDNRGDLFAIVADKSID